MKWNASDFGDVDQIHFASSEIWIPNLVLQNK